MQLKKSYTLITSAIFSTGVFAQVAPTTELEQIVVTATKTEQSIDKVTASVQVITEQDIAKMGASTLKDIFQNTPGLILQYGTFPSGSSASKSSVNIRGVGATGSLWLIDGRRLAGEVKNPYDMDRIPASIIERIEIVKGPMSALYGADAVGGVINIITKQPKEGFNTEITISGGANSNGDGANKQFSANSRGSSGKFRGSFYVSITDTTPYAETEKTDTRVGGKKHKPSELPATPSYLKPDGPTGGKPFYQQADGSVKPIPLDQTKLSTDKTQAQAEFDTFKNKIQTNVKDSYDVDVTYREASKVNTVGGRGEYDITDKLTIGAEFNWFKEERNGVYRGKFHPMGYMPPLGHKTNPIVGHDANGNPIEKRRGSIPSYDVPVNSKDENERLDIAADAEYWVNDDLDIKLRIYRSYYEKRNTTTMAEFTDFGYPSEAKSASSGMNANVDITSYELGSNWQATANHLLTAGMEYRNETREATVFSQAKTMDTREVSYQAVYLQDDFTLHNDLKFTIGGRYDKYDQASYTDEFGVHHKSKSDSETTFRIGMVKNFTKMTNLHMNIAQGYRVPDIRELFIQKQTPAGMQLGAQTTDARFGKTPYDLKAERTLSYEIGLSGRDQKFSYNFVIFQNDIKDKIQKINKGDYYTFENLNDAQTQGAELTLSYAISDSISTNLFWTELTTENKDSGKDLEFNPERVISMAFDFGLTDNLNVGLNATYTGKQYYTDDKGQDKFTNAYTLTNLTADYKFGADNQFKVFGGINNLLDTKVDKRLGSNVGTYYFAGLKVNF